MDNDDHGPGQSRRRFLGVLGGTAAALVLPGCSSSTPAAPPVQLVSLFSSDHVIVAGIEQRLPFGVVDDGISLVGEGDEVTVTVRSGDNVIDEVRVQGRVVGHDHPDGNADTTHQHASLLRYYALRVVLPDPGVYDLEVDFGGPRASLPVQAFDQADVSVLGVGQRFPQIDTPTVVRPGPVDPLCTRLPEACPFHEHTPAELLAAGSPFVLLVATPAYCATAYCGPGLDVLIEAQPTFADLPMIHTEVYENPREVDGNIADPAIRHAPIIGQLGLTFEPSLFLVDDTGTVADRIDNVFDRTEFDAAVTRLLD